MLYFLEKLGCLLKSITKFTKSVKVVKGVTKCTLKCLVMFCVAEARLFL